MNSLWSAPNQALGRFVAFERPSNPETTVIAHVLRRLMIANVLLAAPFASLTGQDSTTTASYSLYLRAGGTFTF